MWYKPVKYMISYIRPCCLQQITFFSPFIPLPFFLPFLLCFLLGCELYQSPLRLCVKSPTKKNCKQLTIDFSKSLKANAKKHCLFSESDVVFLSEMSVFDEGRFPPNPVLQSEEEGLRVRKKGDLAHVEISVNDLDPLVFHCVFDVANVSKEVYIPLAHDLVETLYMSHLGLGPKRFH